jgi:hypothetical protein
MQTQFVSFCLGIALSVIAEAQMKSGAPSSGAAIPVTVDNFIRAETDRTFAANVKQGAFGKFEHLRELSAIDDQRVQRQNRDTLYSVGVFDLDAGPVTVSLPDAGKRFMTMMVVDEDHYVYTVVYGKGSYSFDKGKVGTRYALAAIRTLVDPNDPKDLEQAHALQDAVKVEQSGGPGKFEVPNWDQASRKRIADSLTVLGGSLVDWRNAAGRKDEVDPIRHLIVTAIGWGLNPDKDAIYLNVTPTKNDGKTVYKLNVKDVPVDGFWSITLYNAEGYLVKNDQDAYSFNNITAKKDDNGSVTIQFGGCDGKTPNCLPIMPGWNYTVRLYRPRKEILDGTWKFPEAQPVALTPIERTP